MSFNTSMIFPEVKGKDLKLIKKENSDLRQKSKAVTFAIQFGGNGSTIARNLSIEEEEGHRIYNSYMKAFPGLASYWDSNKREAFRTGYVEFNHVTKRKSYIDFFDEYKKLEEKIRVPGFWDNYRRHKTSDTDEFRNNLLPLVRKYFNYKGDIERRAMNYRVQGTAADITKLASVYIFNYLKENDLLFKVWFPATIHDEVVLECPDTISEELAPIVTKCMEDAGNRFYTRVPFTASTHRGLTWEH